MNQPRLRFPDHKSDTPAGAARALVAFLLLLTACGGAVANQRFSDWNPDDKVVGRFQLVGSHAFSASGVTDKLETPHKYNPLALRLDLERILAFYRERGYFGTRILRTEVADLDPHTVSVRITVDEGQPTRVASLTLQGAPARPGQAALQKLTGLEKGDVFKHPDYLSAKDRVRGRLIDDGYAHAEVGGTVFVDRDSHQAAVEMTLDPGPLTRFGQIHVEGLRRIPESSVRSRIAFAPGDVFDPERLAKTQQRLYGLGYFGTVRLDWQKRGRPEISDVTIHLHEGARHEVRLGGGVEGDQSYLAVHGRASYVVRSWLDPLLTLTLDARPGYALTTSNLTNRGFIGAVVTRLTRDDLLAPRLRGRVETAYELTHFEAYATRGPRTALGLERPFLDDRLQLSAGWQLYYLNVIPVDPAIAGVLGASYPYRLGYYEQSVVWDQRNDPFDPSRGIYAQLRMEEGGDPAGGRFSYLKAVPELRGYVPVGGRVTLASYARVGMMASQNGSSPPLTQRFFGGGATGHRGFSYRRMSPEVRTPGGQVVPIGGEGMLESSLESRIAMVKLEGSWLDLGLFLDAGDVTPTWRQLSLAKLNYAIGTGLRYDTIVGPIRLDVGMRLNRLDKAGPDGLDNPDPGQRFAIHFSLGEAF